MEQVRSKRSHPEQQQRAHGWMDGWMYGWMTERKSAAESKLLWRAGYAGLLSRATSNSPFPRCPHPMQSRCLLGEHAGAWDAPRPARLLRSPPHGASKRVGLLIPRCQPPTNVPACLPARVPASAEMRIGEEMVHRHMLDRVPVARYHRVALFFRLQCRNLAQLSIIPMFPSFPSFALPTLLPSFSYFLRAAPSCTQNPQDLHRM